MGAKSCSLRNKIRNRSCVVLCLLKGKPVLRKTKGLCHLASHTLLRYSNAHIDRICAIPCFGDSGMRALVAVIRRGIADMLKGCVDCSCYVVDLSTVFKDPLC